MKVTLLRRVERSKRMDQYIRWGIRRGKKEEIENDGEVRKFVMEINRRKVCDMKCMREEKKPDYQSD